MGNQSGKQILITYSQEENEDVKEVTFKSSQIPKFLLDLSRRNIISLSYNFEMSSLRSLNLSHNKITTLPDIFECVPNLFSLNISHNQISELPSSINALDCLIEFKAEHNKFTHFPTELFELRNLEKIVLSHNSIKEIDQGIKKLVNLSTVLLHHNLIETLPTEFNLLLFLKNVGLEGCPLLTEERVNEKKEQAKHETRKVPSLKELSARAVLKENMLVEKEQVPNDIVRYLSTSRVCSFCNGPYFEHQVLRYKVASKWGVHVPFVYNLCSSHFKNDRERVFGMFNPKKSNEIHFVQKQNKHDIMLRSKSNILQEQTPDKELKKALSASFANAF